MFDKLKVGTKVKHINSNTIHKVAGSYSSEQRGYTACGLDIRIGREGAYEASFRVVTCKKCIQRIKAKGVEPETIQDQVDRLMLDIDKKQTDYDKLQEEYYAEERCMGNKYCEYERTIETLKQRIAKLEEHREFLLDKNITTANQQGL